MRSACRGDSAVAPRQPALSRCLQTGEHTIKPVDAYWLVLVDELIEVPACHVCASSCTRHSSNQKCIQQHSRKLLRFFVPPLHTVWVAPKHCRNGKFIDGHYSVDPSVVVKFFNRSTSILIAAARIALESSKRISRVEIAGGQSNALPE